MTAPNPGMVTLADIKAAEEGYRKSGHARASFLDAAYQLGVKDGSAKLAAKDAESERQKFLHSETRRVLRETVSAYESQEQEFSTLRAENERLRALIDAPDAGVIGDYWRGLEMTPNPNLTALLRAAEPTANDTEIAAQEEGLDR